MDCWNFKADMRPSFIQINEKLNTLLIKYERKKFIEEQHLIDMKKLSLGSLGLHLNSSSLIETPKRFGSVKQSSSKLSTPERTSSLSQQPYKTSLRNGSLKSSLLTNLDTTSRLNRQSESEDSQYFSGTDTSLVYADSSNFSTYSNYSVLPTLANKAATMMCASLAQRPPSPPPIQKCSKLLNVASAAFQL